MNYIYGEVVLLENFIINFLILMFTTKILRKKQKVHRLIIAALLGAIYSIMQYKYSIFTHYTFKIFLSVLIILISFHPKNVREFTNNMLLFYAISLLFGGCVIALIILSNHSSNMTLNIYGVRSSTVALGVFIGIIAIIKARELIIDVKCKNANILSICIILGLKELHTKGFKDTGCNIRDPITGKPVLLVEYDVIQEILPQEIRNYFLTYDETMDIEIDKKIVDIHILKKIKFIPYNTVNTMIHSYLLCYQFDAIELFDDKDKHRIDRVYIGICKRKLSENHEFQALINPKLLYMNGGF